MRAFATAAPGSPARVVRAISMVVAAALFACAPWATAQTWPARPVKLVVGFGPGGVADITARVVAQKLSQDLGQQFVVDNRLSAGGIVAAEAVAKAEPDGYTLLLMSNGNAVSASLRPRIRSSPPSRPEAARMPAATAVSRVLARCGSMSATTVPTQFPFREYMGVALAMSRGLVRQTMGMVEGWPSLCRARKVS